ncbi:hypothetical protein N657DRAFT_94225 [Parathielavia appendiculata]|uniref:Secreted protein n=1 Tax=Parathielavia appendiculata TaxID=2587402 RepID=A0AAN6UC53_9PEZI|nr:hypothetical protein N657DRAFT_94225 [Parathielavia appendiculata]
MAFPLPIFFSLFYFEPLSLFSESVPPLQRKKWQSGSYIGLHCVSHLYPEPWSEFGTARSTMRRTKLHKKVRTRYIYFLRLSIMAAVPNSEECSTLQRSWTSLLFSKYTRCLGTSSLSSSLGLSRTLWMGKISILLVTVFASDIAPSSPFRILFLHAASVHRGRR